MFTGSGPSATAARMLEYKSLEYERVHLMLGPHAFGLIARGFRAMTVPALEIDGRRVQGSRQISRVLDDVEPLPPLFPAERTRRQAVVDAERWGEDFQDGVRRVILCAARHDPRVFLSVYRHPNPTARGLQRSSARVLAQLATFAHGATDDAARTDLASLPTRLDRIDAWIDSGLLNGPVLNAADFQIAPAIALLLCLDDVRAAVDHRPAARLARRVVPAVDARAPASLPNAWLTPLQTVARQHGESPGYSSREGGQGRRGVPS